MQIVIDINDKLYDRIKYLEPTADTMLDKLMRSVQNGRPLPKGHGDLIDVNKKITIPTYDEQYEEWSEKTLTVREVLNWSDEGITVTDVVIPADKAESDE